MKIINLKSIDSTNDYCKRNLGEDLIVIAEEQSNGRGTKGRSFVSNSGGLYISVMKNYGEFPASDSFKIMINSCVAVCKTLESFGVSPKIRWANDVLADGKKICGILIENTLSDAYISRSIVGIGLNINNTLPENLKDIATTLFEQTEKSISVEAVRKILIENLQKEYSIDDYRAYISWLNSPVTLKFLDGEVVAKAISVENDGRLKVEIGGEIKIISSAEVSLKL